MTGLEGIVSVIACLHQSSWNSAEIRRGVLAVRNIGLVSLCTLVGLLCTGGYVYAQATSQAQESFVGCYEVVSLTWNPSTTEESYIPQRFELTDRPSRIKGQMEMRSVPKPVDDAARFSQRLWLWRRNRNKAVVSFGWGLGGFAGTLKPSQATELVGTLKYFCDTIVCGGPSGRIRVRQVECPQ